MTKRDWKSALQRSGLPFEFFVSKVLEQREFDVYGEFAFSRKDRGGQEVECSVDLSAAKALTESSGDGQWTRAVTTRLLVECKYNVPGTSWIFMPGAYHGLDSQLTIVDVFSCAHIRERNCTAFPQLMPRGIKGVCLKDGDAQDQTIHTGLGQLRFGTIQVMRECLGMQLVDFDDYALPVYLVGAVLVTTAELRVLQNDLDLVSYSSAESLEDISEKVPYICMSTVIGPDLSAAIRETEIELKNSHNKAWDQRALAKRKAVEAAGLKRIAGNHPFNLFRRSMNRIFVVNFDHLPAFLDVITTMTNAAFAASSIVARIEQSGQREGEMTPHLLQQ